MKKAILSQEELISFCREMNLIMASSIPIQEGLESVIEGMGNEEAADALRLSLAHLEEGNQVSESFKQSGLFSPYMLSMLVIGERTGKLDHVMAALADYYEKNRRIAQKVRSGTIYPLVIAAMVLVIVGVMVTKVLPIFEGTFQVIGGELPRSVRQISVVGKILIALLILAFVSSVAAVIIFSVMYRTREGRVRVNQMLKKLPYVENIYRTYQTALFSNSLSLLVSSGYDLHESLEMTSKATDDSEYRGKIEQAIRQLEQGEPLYRVLEEMRIFKGVHSRLVRLSVQTGHIDSVLREVSEKYSAEVEDSIDKLIGVIEPALVGATSLIIGGILITVMLPLMVIMSSIG